MIRLSEHLRPEDIRSLNRELYKRDAAYLASDVWTEPATETLRHINNVKSSKVQAAINAVEPFEETEIPRAWSHHMALQCGIHFWPDANHRTAIIGFNLALERATGWNVVLGPEMGQRCVEESKAARKKLYPNMTMAKLADAEHQYRKVFAEFESALVVTEAGSGLLY